MFSIILDIIEIELKYEWIDLIEDIYLLFVLIIVLYGNLSLNNDFFWGSKNDFYEVIGS